MLISIVILNDANEIGLLLVFSTLLSTHTEHIQSDDEFRFILIFRFDCHQCCLNALHLNLYGRNKHTTCLYWQLWCHFQWFSFDSRCCRWNGKRWQRQSHLFLISVSMLVTIFMCSAALVSRSDWRHKMHNVFDTRINVVSQRVFRRYSNFVRSYK